MCRGSCFVSCTISLLYVVGVMMQDPDQNIVGPASEEYKVVIDKSIGPDAYPCTIVSSKCVFPFTYLGVTYNRCTTADNYGEYWCSHTAVYSGGQWSPCRCPGIYEVSVAPLCTNTANCVFPFEYYGYGGNGIYSECSQVENYGQYWCSNDDVYSGGYSDCDCTTTVTNIPENPCIVPEECVFPFQYQGITYLTCSTVDNGGKYWCAHDAVYYSEWSYCDCPDTYEVIYKDTVSSNAPPDCELPFTYDGFCDTTENDNYWFANSSIYNGGFLDCLCGKPNISPPGSDDPCILPRECVVTDDSLTDMTCTTSDWVDYWCAHQDVYYGEWSECQCPEDLADYPCDVPTECVFPFIYYGMTYMSCATTGSVSYWCAHETVYSGEWSYCQCPDERANACIVPSECVFPFQYDGWTYESCTTDGLNDYWCAHSSVYNGSWSYCQCPQ